MMIRLLLSHHVKHDVDVASISHRNHLASKLSKKKEEKRLFHTDCTVSTHH
jgi:hypothetical protein